jgi:hypothetical protein
MRDLRELDHYRQRGQAVIELHGWEGDERCGAFIVPSPVDRAAMVVIASSDMGWDHVSVSRRNRPPNWTEMEHVKRAFFRDNETAMQVHVPPSDHVNNMPNALHLWRPLEQEIPRPPGIMVGIGNEPLRSHHEALALHKRAVDSSRI